MFFLNPSPQNHLERSGENQEILTPLANASITCPIALNILKDLLESRKRKLSEPSNNDPFFLLLDKTSRDVIDWWSVCVPAQVGKFSVLDSLD